MSSPLSHRRLTSALAAVVLAAVPDGASGASPEPGIAVLDVTYQPQVALGSAGFKEPISPVPEVHLDNQQQITLTIANGDERSDYIWIQVHGLPWATSVLTGRGKGPALVNDDLEVVAEVPPIDWAAITVQAGTPQGDAPLWVRFDPMEAGEETELAWWVEFVSGPRELAMYVQVFTGDAAFGVGAPESARLIWEGEAPVTVVALSANE